MAARSSSSASSPSPSPRWSSPASRPAATALAWVGLCVEIVGAALLWNNLQVSNINTASLDALGVQYSVLNLGGFQLLGASVAAHIIAAALISAANYCAVGSLPGVGRSHTNCCCVERDAAHAPAGAALETRTPITV